MMNNEQIEIIATLFARGECDTLESFDREWILIHAFEIGAKFYRDFNNVGESLQELAEKEFDELTIDTRKSSIDLIKEAYIKGRMKTNNN